MLSAPRKHSDGALPAHKRAISGSGMQRLDHRSTLSAIIIRGALNKQAAKHRPRSAMTLLRPFWFEDRNAQSALPRPLESCILHDVSSAKARSQSKHDRVSEAPNSEAVDAIPNSEAVDVLRRWKPTRESVRGDCSRSASGASDILPREQERLSIHAAGAFRRAVAMGSISARRQGQATQGRAGKGPRRYAGRDTASGSRDSEQASASCSADRQAGASSHGNVAKDGGMKPS